MSDFCGDILDGLLANPKQIPSKYFYDEVGANLFEQITQLEEYYPTRTEIGILNAHLAEIAKSIGPRAAVIEFGSGAGRKTRMLLDKLVDPIAYVPIDISGEQLESSSVALRIEYPKLEVFPIVQDFTQHVELPRLPMSAAKKIVFFPGSTIGNFEPDDAGEFLERCRAICGKNGGMVIGVDLVKEITILERAYNDSAGVTAQFNLHLIERLRDELQLAVHPEDFEHFAFFNQEASRIEMHLVAKCDVAFVMEGHEIQIDADEHIITEYSYKYTPSAFKTLAVEAGFQTQALWTDEREWFGEFYLASS